MSALDFETMTEIVEEGDTEFLACLHQAEEGVARVAAGLGPGFACHNTLFLLNFFLDKLSEHPGNTEADAVVPKVRSDP